MDNYSKIYWLTRLDHVSDLLTGIGVCSIIGAVIYLVIAYAFMDKEFESEERGKEIDVFRGKASRLSKILVCVGIFIIALKAFIPTKNEALIIIAGGKTMDYIQKDTSLSKIPYQTTSIISEYLDKTIKELKENKK